MLPTNNVIKEIKISLSQGNIKSFVSLMLETEEVEIFKIVKEQKLILLCPTTEVFNSYANAVLRLLCGEILEQELRYLQFVSMYFEIKQTLLTKINKLSIPLCSVRFSRLLQSSTEIIDSWIEELFSHMVSESTPINYENLNLEEKSKYSEILHNSMRGRLNDSVFALLRLLNIIQHGSLKTENYSFCEDDKIEGVLTEVFTTVGYLNSLDYIIDNLSYGTCKISKIVNRKKPTVWLDFNDINFVKSRELGLRRMLAQKLMGSKRDSWLVQKLNPIAEKALEKAWEYYGKNDATCSKYLESKKILIAELKQISVEDELLVSFGSNEEIIKFYTKSIVVLSYLIVMNLIDTDEFPIDSIKNNLKCIIVKEKFLDDDLSFILTEMPVSSHFELLSKPVLVSTECTYHIIKYNSYADWVQWARNSCMKGGSIADKVGKSWESFADYTFNLNNWNILGSSIEIKKNKNKITDIDLLIEKDNIIFLIQMKTFYTLDHNEYSQWKSREKLRKAAKQLKAVDLTLIKEQFFKIGKSISANKIYPMILTNLHLYNGWDCDGARVVSFNSLNQFFNGANVDFVTNQGEILCAKNYMNKNNSLANEFISFIEKPLDWRLSNDEIKTNHHQIKFKNFNVQIPVIDELGLL